MPWIAATPAATASVVSDWKGAEWLSVSASPVNVRKCGAPASGNYELHFLGSGIDTADGTFTVEAAGCVDLKTLRVTKLRAKDSFAGGTLEIITDDVTLHRSADACVVANRPAGSTARTPCNPAHHGETAHCQPGAFAAVRASWRNPLHRPARQPSVDVLHAFAGKPRSK